MISDDDVVSAYNAAVRALHKQVSHLIDAPCLAPQLIRADRLVANDYNPNRVAPVELDLLEDSIRADGVTMPVVVVEGPEGWFTVVDGFHRQTVIKTRLGGKYVPCSVISSAMADRIASTVRHNRARGKHQVDLMANLVGRLLREGWEDAAIAEHLGMSGEELLRLKQQEGVAHLMAAPEYTRFVEEDLDEDLADE